VEAGLARSEMIGRKTFAIGYLLFAIALSYWLLAIA
jgi:hypothetical protein